MFSQLPLASHPDDPQFVKSLRLSAQTQDPPSTEGTFKNATLMQKVCVYRTASLDTIPLTRLPSSQHSEKQLITVGRDQR